MKRVILHAGTHKTGTKALQYFAREKPELLREHGIYYPSNGRPIVGPTEAHHLLAWSLAGELKDASYWPDSDHSWQHVWGALLDEIQSRSESTFLLSSEELSTVSAESIGAIANILTGFEIVPIIYFRRFDEYLQAVYSTSVVFGLPIERRSISDFIASSQDPLDYRRTVGAWRSTFGESLKVRPFNRSTLISQSIVCDLLASVGYGIDVSHARSYSRVNAGIPWNLVECARILNKLNASRWIMEKLRECSDRLYKDGISYELLPPSARRQLVQRTIGFFEQEFVDALVDEEHDEFWSHLRGADLPDSDADWVAAHGRSYSFLSRTVLDILAAAYRGSVARRWAGANSRAMPTT